ncbi:MAG TPA: septal ring lytic transglycosylase RlpA family protein [Candidatus Kapabacteria bacterium]|nr:septal ring lytic transglycosylase RlpA family protein [Candidatus Kapabacteria bacterium]
MLQIDRNKTISFIAISNIIALIIVFTTKQSIAQQSNSSLKLFNTPIPISIYEQVDFGESQLWSSIGIASFYGNKFHMRKTSSGERYDMHDNTAAHRTLPFGTILRVVNNKNQKSSLLKVNDRGPFIKKRVIDLSRAVSQEIGSSGLANVTVSGFVPGKIQLNDPENFFLAYTTTDNPAIYNKEIFEIISNYEEFQDAYDDYDYLITQNTSFENNLYILIAADEYQTNPKKVQYKLGYFKNFEPKRIPFSIAEREKK